MAELSTIQTRHLAATLEERGLARRRFTAPYFAEVAMVVSDAARRHVALAEQGIVAGYLMERDDPTLRDTLLFACTELTTDAEIGALADALEALP